MEKILKYEMIDLYKNFAENPGLDFEIELKKELFTKCSEAEILTQVNSKESYVFFNFDMNLLYFFFNDFFFQIRLKNSFSMEIT